MFRSSFAAALGAAFGALTVAPLRERFSDMLLQPSEACAVGAASIAAGLIGLFIMACRQPAPRHGHQLTCCGANRPTPPTGGSRGVKPPRASDGRFAKGR